MTHVKCYKYQGLGHRSFECTANVEDRRQPITCFVCQQQGHKLWECPTKSSSAENFSKSEPVKKFGVKPGGPVKNVNWMVVTDSAHVMTGSVNGIEYDIALDTGVEITLVPGYLVYESQLIGRTESVKGATGV